MGSYKASYYYPGSALDGDLHKTAKLCFNGIHSNYARVSHSHQPEPVRTRLGGACKMGKLRYMVGLSRPWHGGPGIPISAPYQQRCWRLFESNTDSANTRLVSCLINLCVQLNIVKHTLSHARYTGARSNITGANRNTCAHGP